MESDRYDWWKGILWKNQIVENYEDRLTDDIEVLKLGKFSSKTDIENIEDESDEINRIYIIYDK